MAELVAGVDGGQSSTTAAIADESGCVLGRGAGPPADLVGEPRESRRQRDAIATALRAALSDAGLSASTPLRALVAGLTGHDEGMPARSALESLADTVAVVHDTAIAHAGALGGHAGIVVIAGTGSVALGNAAPGEAFIRAGGWGYFFGDAGSALWIAREAIASAMRDFDAGEPSQLGEAALRFFGAPDLRSIQHAFAHGDLTRSALAAFAIELLAMTSGSPPSMPMQAWHIRNHAVRALVELVELVHQRLPAVPARRISYSGGVFASEGLRRSFRDVIERSVIVPPGGRLRMSVPPSEDDEGAEFPRRFEGAEVVEPIGNALDGAVSLAGRLRSGEPLEARVADEAI